VTEDRRIVAVVVTHDRRELVQRLVKALSDLGGLEEVLVVDNASDDGTGEWLAGLGESRVLGRTLADNTGGAGGFHEGLRWAVERGADLVWLMDDDGFPEPECLDTLVRYAGDLDLWGPVVVDEADPDRLVFPIRPPGGTRVLHDMGDVRRAADGGAHPRHRHPLQRGAGHP
jgi:rhamnopyranosyl-N-acetylglucosaminyl-diphospho-decaprenol beta-1,3/1,4-galactofuranosyltransferase